MNQELLGLLRDRVSAVWLVLLAAAVGSLLLGTDNVVHPAKLAGALVIVVAFVKVRFVGLYFMELREAPIQLRLLLEAYCAVMCTTLVVVFLVAR